MLTWTLFELTQHPEALEKVKAQIRTPTHLVLGVPVNLDLYTVVRLWPHTIEHQKFITDITL